MIIDLLNGKTGDEVNGSSFKIVGECCCFDMCIGLTFGHLVSSGLDMEIPNHEDNDSTKPIEGGLTISHCPWCGEKIETINPWKPYWTEQVLDELAPDYMFWF